MLGKLLFAVARFLGLSFFGFGVAGTNCRLGLGVNIVQVWFEFVVSASG